MSAFEARRSFGRALDSVLRGERVVIEKHGRPVAVIVPVEVYDQWLRSRGEFFSRLRTEAGTSGDATRVGSGLVEREQ